MRSFLEGALAITLGVLVALAVTSGCKSVLGIAWKATYGVKQAGELASETIGALADKKHEACLGKYPSKSTEYTQCVGPMKRLLEKWRDIAKPAINSALAATVGALLIAERAGVDKALSLMNVWKLIKPGICALAQVVEAWSGWIPQKTAKQLRTWLQLAKGVTCG